MTLQLPQQEQNPHQQHGKGAQQPHRSELPQPSCLWGLRWDLLNQRKAQDGFSSFQSTGQYPAAQQTSPAEPNLRL